MVEFLGNCERKGWIKPATAHNMRNACERVFGILEADESKDISKFDVEELLRRFHNCNQDVSAASLRAYGSRIRTAIGEFLRYKQDPSRWKPQIETRVRGRTDDHGEGKAKAPKRRHDRSWAFPPLGKAIL